MNIKNLKLLTHDEIRKLYKEYLYSYLDNKKSSVDVTVSQTLYLWKNVGKEAFFDIVLDDNFELNGPKKIREYLQRNTVGDIDNLVNLQMTSLRKFRNFIETFKIVKYTKKDIEFLDNMDSPYKFKIPSPMQVAICVNDTKDSIEQQEFDYLYRLGQREDSHLSQFSVYTKLLAVNSVLNLSFKSDFLLEITNKIINTSVSKNINDGSTSVMKKFMELIKDNPDVNVKLYYSLISLYLSISKPESFPLYDKKIESLFVYLNKNKVFKTKFTNDDLLDYGVYKKVYDEFRVKFSLCGYSYKDINMYLINLSRNNF